MPVRLLNKQQFAFFHTHSHSHSYRIFLQTHHVRSVHHNHPSTTKSIDGAIKWCGIQNLYDKWKQETHSMTKYSTASHASHSSLRRKSFFFSESRDDHRQRKNVACRKCSKAKPRQMQTINVE